MTQTLPRVLWSDNVDSQNWRLVDLGPGNTPRFLIEQQMPPDALGSRGWQGVGLPFANVLERAFLALMPPGT